MRLFPMVSAYPDVVRVRGCRVAVSEMRPLNPSSLALVQLGHSSVRGSHMIEIFIIISIILIA